jgi:ketosteroid isomerase-like protein
VIRKTYEAWNRHDLDSWLETYHSDGELDTSGLFPDSDPVYRGRDRLAEFWRRMHEAWEVFRIDIDRQIRKATVSP